MINTELRDLCKVLAKRPCMHANWGNDAGRDRKGFIDKVKECQTSGAIDATLALAILKLLDKFEQSSHPIMIVMGTKHLSVKLRNHEETSLLGIFPDGTLSKPADKNSSLVPKAEVERHRAGLGRLQSMDDVERVFKTVVDYIAVVKKKLSLT